MNFTEMLDRLGRDAEASARSIAQRFVDGDLQAEEAVDALAMAVRSSNTRGMTLGEAACRELLGTLGDPEARTTDSEAAAHFEDPARITQAAETVMAKKSSVYRAGRLAKAEAVEAGQKMFGETLRSSPYVEGWRRGLDADPCELCTWWWRENRTWPKGWTMPTHKGCTCRQVPVTIARENMRLPGRRAWRASDQRAAQREEESNA